MPDFLPPLLTGIGLAPLIALAAVCLRWGLITLVAIVGILNEGPKGDNARRVLKLLLRKNGPPRLGGT